MLQNNTNISNTCTAHIDNVTNTKTSTYIGPNANNCTNSGANAKSSFSSINNRHQRQHVKKHRHKLPVMMRVGSTEVSLNTLKAYRIDNNY